MKSLLLSLFFLFGSGFGIAQNEAMVPLFNGKNLDGWTQRGGVAKYRVENDAIIGTTVPKTPNSFLCTEKEYGDFVLELEFKVDPTLNCGIQFRSLSKPDYHNGRVHGYQCEIDPSDRAWTAGIYDEGRRGWLNDLSGNRKARYAFRQNQWNHVRIVAIGARIQTFLNGVPAADLIDSETQKGFIALQVHGIGNREEALEVAYRKISIIDLGESTWEPVFNGKDLNGFSSEIPEYWSVKDKVLHGKSPASEKRHSILLLDREVGDFTARIRYLAKAGNSGFYFRCEEVDSPVSVNGFQAEIDAAGKSESGLYETGGRAWVAEPAPELVARHRKEEDWNTLDVSAYGSRLTTNLNGIRMVEWHGDPGRLKGRAGLQLHGAQDMDLEIAALEFLKTSHRIEDFTSATVSTRWKPGKESGPIIAEGAKWRQLGSGYKFTEGPALAPDGRIYFNDIPNERTHIYDPGSGEITVFQEKSGRANGLFFTGPGALMSCEGGNRRVTRIEDGEVTVLAEKFDGKKLNSPNDIVLDGIGGFYFTDPRYGKRDDMELEVEAVYYVDRGGKISQVAADLKKPNGLIFSPDESVLYIADPGAETIWAYHVAAPGQLSKKRKFAGVGSDGMTVDERGNIYCTWKGEVIAFSPDGKEVLRSTPPEGPANCLLVGKTLYVTARKGFYAIDTLVSGL